MDDRSTSELPGPVDRYQEMEPAPPAADPPHWTLWFVYLLVRPGLFFETFVLRKVAVLTVLTAWLLGIAGSMDEVASRQMLSNDPNPLYTLMQADWRTYWGVAAALGVLVGAARYAIGG